VCQYDFGQLSASLVNIYLLGNRPQRSGEGNLSHGNDPRKRPHNLTAVMGPKYFQNVETVIDLFFAHRFDNNINSAVLLPIFLRVIAGNRPLRSITDSG
jgi:hypothetical protein